jgi:hypothetical protein
MLENLKPGDQLLRREVHARYGGRQQGGIGPSTRSPVVLFFTDPAKGHLHGYYDGLDDDGLFNYYGEGQLGDQRLVQGNKAILNHVIEGRSLEGFLASGTKVTYLGTFDLVDFYWTDAHESGSTTLRQVVVFRLRPMGEIPVPLPRVPVTVIREPVVTMVPVEEQYTERALATPNREPYELERREATLVDKYREHLNQQGHEVGRLRVLPLGESAPLYCDLWDETSRELVVAKGVVTREQLRSAVGQLFDYGRFVTAELRAVLLPTKPRPDLLAYLTHVGVDAVYPVGDGWERN